jgi:hypothetical protein
MTIFSTDTQRERAAQVKVLLARLQSCPGERGLGVDIVDVVEAPRTIGDPTRQVDAALSLAKHLGQNPGEVAASVFRFKRVDCTVGEIARMLCAVVLRVHLAKLEGAPA